MLINVKSALYKSWKILTFCLISGDSECAKFFRVETI
jgi:hypothetical protein